MVVLFEDVNGSNSTYQGQAAATKGIPSTHFTDLLANNLPLGSMAQPSSEAPLDPLTGLPKEEASHSAPSPPPAYCPPARHLRQQAAAQRVADDPSRPISAAQFFQLRNMNMNNANHDNREYINLDHPRVDDDDDDDDARSPIELRITTTVQIEGDNNAILLTASPADHARAIAEAVTATVRQAGGMNGGIPMIDEEGRPRPFRIFVSAGMNIEGSGNVLGNEDHVMLFVAGKRKRDHGGGDGEGDGGVAAKTGDGAAAAPPPPRRLRRSSA